MKPEADIVIEDGARQYKIRVVPQNKKPIFFDAKLGEIQEESSSYFEEVDNK